METKGKEYRFFGVMLDMSRNAVMKVSEVKKMIDHLHKMGYNMLQLYTEDTYEIEGEPYFGYLRGRYTGKEIKEIDAYAKSQGIELIPCVQTLAHFTALVKNDIYAPIVDANDILLAGDENTYELIEKIFKTLAENFTSRHVNIGMDEAHMVGLGKYLDKNGYCNRFDILLEHLKKVAEIAAKYGFKAHMWSDMFFRLANKGAYYSQDPAPIPESVKKSLPENVDIVYWDYYHQEKEWYDAMLAAHKEFNGETWFAGGAWSWNGFAPMHALTLGTMKAAMESVREQGVKNVLITMWGDNGKECSFYSLLPMLYAIRQYANGNFDQKKIEKGFYDLFRLKYADFLSLELPNKPSVDGENWTENPCKSLLYNDLFLGILDKTVATRRPIPYTEYADILKKAAKRAGQFEYIFTMEEKLCRVLEIKAGLGVKIRRAYQAKDKKELSVILKDCKTLEKRLEEFHLAFYTLWHKENKPHGWEVQDARIGGVMRRLQTCEMRLKEYISGRISQLEELEEDILPYDSEERNSWYCNVYTKLVSRSLL